MTTPRKSNRLPNYGARPPAPRLVSPLWGTPTTKTLRGWYYIETINGVPRAIPLPPLRGVAPPPTVNQQAARDELTRLMRSWAALSLEQQATYNAAGREHCMTGINWFLKNPPPSIFCLDTFTGAPGTLTAHTGEIGATWTHQPGVGQSDPTALLLDGNGQLYVDPNLRGRVLFWPAGQPDPGNPYTITITMQFDPTQGYNTQLSIYQHSGPDTPGNADILAVISPSDIEIINDDGEQSAIAANQGPDPFTAQIYIDPDATITITANGATLGPIQRQAPITLPIGMAPYDNTAGPALKVLSFSITPR
jgi:hypothetical protein